MMIYQYKHSTVSSRYSRPLNCGHLNIAAAYLGMDLKQHQDCTNLAPDLRSPRYIWYYSHFLRPQGHPPILLILQPEVTFIGVVMVKYDYNNLSQEVELFSLCTHTHISVFWLAAIIHKVTVI